MDYETLVKEVKSELSQTQLKHWVEKIMGFPLSPEVFNQAEANAKLKYDLQNRLYGNINTAYYILLTVDMVAQIAQSYSTMYCCNELRKKGEL